MIMANKATNIIFIEFPKTSTADNKMKFYGSMEASSHIAGIDSNSFADECAEYNSIELTFFSYWTAPKEFLQQLCDTYGCSITGVSYEFGNYYTETIELTKFGYGVYDPEQKLFRLDAEDAYRALCDGFELMVKGYGGDSDNYTGICISDFEDYTEDDIRESLSDYSDYQIWP